MKRAGPLPLLRVGCISDFLLTTALFCVLSILFLLLVLICFSSLLFGASLASRKTGHCASPLECCVSGVFQPKRIRAGVPELVRLGFFN